MYDKYLGYAGVEKAEIPTAAENGTGRMRLREKKMLLQLKMETGLRTGEWDETDSTQLEEKAFDSHSEAYSKGGLSKVFIPDLLKIASEVAFVDFKPTKTLHFTGFFFSYDFPKPMKVVGCCGFVHTIQGDCRSRCGSCYEVLNETFLLVPTQSTFPRSTVPSQIGYLGQPLKKTLIKRPQSLNENMACRPSCFSVSSPQNPPPRTPNPPKKVAHVYNVSH